MDFWNKNLKYHSKYTEIVQLKNKEHKRHTSNRWKVGDGDIN